VSKVAEYNLALVADEVAAGGIAAELRRCGFAWSAFEDVDALLVEMRRNAPKVDAIVLWIGDVAGGLSGELERLARSVQGIPVIAVCDEIERWGVRAALSAGAGGLVRLGDLQSALAPSVTAVLAGQACVPRAYWRQIDPPALSSREKQILGLVVMGFTNGQIAQQLFLAESTVKSHLSSAFGKLGVRSRNAAVSLILDPDSNLGMGILSLGGEPIAVQG
jgi:DNA-binding NarL/FixJ family response regulator